MLTHHLLASPADSINMLHINASIRIVRCQCDYDKVHYKTNNTTDVINSPLNFVDQLSHHYVAIHHHFN